MASVVGMLLETLVLVTRRLRSDAILNLYLTSLMQIALTACIAENLSCDVKLCTLHKMPHACCLLIRSRLFYNVEIFMWGRKLCMASDCQVD